MTVNGFVRKYKWDLLVVAAAIRAPFIVYVAAMIDNLTVNVLGVCGITVRTGSAMADRCWECWQSHHCKGCLIALFHAQIPTATPTTTI